MPMSTEDGLDRAHATALQRWQAPFPDFASGHDRRTSDAGLLELFYGGLLHAAAHDWLNAGRRLIDKTYVDMLWHVQRLTRMRACGAEQIAAALDDFIRGEVALRWTTLGQLTADDRAALARAWVEHLATHGFGSMHSEAAASRLLFYLCPTLPVFNLSSGHLLALRQLDHPAPSQRYGDYAAHAAAAYRERLPALLDRATPVGTDGDAARQVLAETDWWPRRLFDQLLREQVREGDATLFACDDAGQLVVGRRPPG